MLFRSIFILCLGIKLSHGATQIYDRYTGELLTSEGLAEYQELDVVENCTIEIETCDENEWRRLDGSCNNLKYPARGTFFVPMDRMLPAHYYNGSYPRKSSSGKELTIPRVVRTTVLTQGISKHPDLTQLVTGYLLYTFFDFGSIHDIIKMLFEKSDCCQEEHMNDYECTPNIIPEDDPVHRFSSIRCMNLTRPLSFQDFKCTKDSEPAPIQKATAAYDKSFLYFLNTQGDGVIRTYTLGQLAVEVEDGKTWPPNGPSSNCPMNTGDETRCFKNYLNSLVPVNLFTIWFMRYHNYVAAELAALNPCWDDETLFQHARDINIAYTQQMFVYELLPVLIGRETMENAGVVNDHPGFRDIYDDDLYPTVLLEFAYILRWFHTIQAQTARLYDTKGNHLSDYPTFNITFKTGWMALDNRLTYLTQGAFREPSNGPGSTIVYDIGERGLPGMQHAVDVVTSDLSKGRLLGMAPYIDYVFKCSGINITCFKDLEQIMKPQQIKLLELVYEKPEDIDMMAGMWSEEPIKGGKIPSTQACIINTHMLKVIKSDRHWYERKDRPHSFNADQLLEIRKATVSNLICTVGDGVTEIQKRGFLNIDLKNPLVNCSEIPQLNLTAWYDPTCSSEEC